VTHRAEQVIQAAASKISAQTDVGAPVYPHRVLSLSDEDQEIPAICPLQGADEPLEWNFAFIDSELELRVAAYAKKATEVELAAELARMRAAIHRALLSDPTLGLAFVLSTTYRGASEPEKDTSGGLVAGKHEFLFAVQYRMNTTDPE